MALTSDRMFPETVSRRCTVLPIAIVFFFWRSIGFEIGNSFGIKIPVATVGIEFQQSNWRKTIGVSELLVPGIALSNFDSQEVCNPTRARLLLAWGNGGAPCPPRYAKVGLLRVMDIVVHRTFSNINYRCNPQSFDMAILWLASIYITASFEVP